MDYKDSKFANDIIKLQNDDGSWGNSFHSLSIPTSKQTLTTEQALRRLKILGYTIDDEPIKKAVKYLENCLTGKIKIPEKPEKLHNWKIFTELMFSTWIKIFTIENKLINENVKKWSTVINDSFVNGAYDNNKYVSIYEKIFGLKPKGGRFIDFVTFYQISLLTNSLDKSIEPLFFKYVLNNDVGIYYIYEKKLISTPIIFKAKETSLYLSAIELLAEYNNSNCKKQLDYVIKWLKNNMDKGNLWDMGKEVKDGIYFPLSDSWRKEEDRIKDCTYRIKKLVEKLEKENRNFA